MKQTSLYKVLLPSITPPPPHINYYGFMGAHDAYYASLVGKGLSDYGSVVIDVYYYMPPLHRESTDSDKETTEV